ncbi:MAG: MotA/TolQ/ExbB proton channel family protein [Aminobacterium sp.]|jgi:biopolymer transport protein ExbB|uniref:MotA/TolQ/ExbB proton channel domain-containing protein n=1 Tax=bioreactor metagenome TaxID=1076179 RepID=A0A645DKL6_9ZZZZ|nr:MULTISPECIES: MotA/TolQ/ExbB proton channel family protein [unclassified Aminobacterium]MDD2206415.1 MotA/TolQ/ExbB proton channel family protein [Aminobacterium sp.]MDD3425401.1 MotA/TolQ/ExbB proton channel family protein [Aminobacterium sp.]MDD3707746.1 MotA/TolQ/ExbB proton channel family protein [Aminobacterium sp.]MDD4228250.1 MotA/TolQ/ExbB proton channel family protein [Aminobacterium sp.]MDD4551287.1 MotA/TolQ/ExbB proton channel family protein [Aminobacterium sp.]
MEIMRAGGPIMWIIFFLSIIALAVFVERLFFFRRSSTDPEKLELSLCKALYENNAEQATKIVRSGDSSLHRLFIAAVTHWQVDTEAFKLLLEQQIRRELFRWLKGLSLLATISRVAPLLGLLGTVLGMVQIFRDLPQANQAPMIALSGGIWQALLTTVAGLSIAVPTVLAYTYLSAKIDDQEETLYRGADFLIREKLMGTTDPSLYKQGE